MPIRHFTELDAWQASRTITIEVYMLLRTFPRYELYGLCDQLRRSAISVCSNIAEGFGRPTRNSKQYFYSIALGSLAELECQLIIAKDLKYVSSERLEALKPAFIRVQKLITALHHGARDAPI